MIRHLRRAYRALLPFSMRIFLRDLRLLGRVALQPASSYRAQLRTLVNRHPGAKGVIMLPPSAFGWSTGMFQRPHHLARELARLGYLVMFMTYDYAEVGGQPGFHEVEQRLWLAALPYHVWAAVFSVIKQPILLLTTYHHLHLPLFGDPLLVYDHYDHLDVFTDEQPIERLRAWHGDLLLRSSVVLASSDALRESLAVSRPDVVLCPNGVDADYFARTPAAVPEAMQAICDQGRPIIGYYGALARWLDYDLLRECAEQMPDCTFVLIGSDHDGSFGVSGLSLVGNVRRLPAVPYADLPAYLACFAVAIIPFRVTPLTEAVSPLKLFEYMAGGCPVVTTALPECRKYPPVSVAESRGSFVALLRHALTLRQDAAHVEALRATARTQSWSRRAHRIDAALSQARTSSVQKSSR
jgi:hypothetical protein